MILDVVYNHTAEGNHLGPTLAFKGIDNAAYYRLVAGRPHALHGLHGHRQHAQHAQPPRPAAGHGQPALLGHGDARRRLPLRPGVRAGPRAARGRPAVGLLRPHPAGPGDQPGQADRRAVGRGRGRLPGRQLPAAVGRVERQVPRLRARLLAGRGAGPRRGRLPPHRLVRPVRVERAQAVRQRQLHHRARRLHAAGPGLVQRQAQRGQRRGQRRRRQPQPLVELRRRGPDGRRGGARAAGPADAELPRHAAAVAGHPDAAGRRRAGPHAGRQQQRVLPGQRGVLDRLGRRRTPSWPSS